MSNKQLLRTTGWVAIAIGVYLIHKGSEGEPLDFEIKDDVLDAEFTILED